jgi:hypothetical protein
VSNQERPISRGFKGRRVEPANRDRVPPGQTFTDIPGGRGELTEQLQEILKFRGQPKP